MVGMFYIQTFEKIDAYGHFVQVETLLLRTHEDGL